ncbi:MAG: 50S ribosomal protein L19 [Candidatus Paceibacterota bacterium]
MVVTNIKFSPVDIEARKKLDFHAGDTIRVWSKISEEKTNKKGKSEGAKFRLQAFEGIVLARKHGTEAGATFTVRKIASGVGVERIFPLFAPTVDRIEVVKKSKVRRSKLYYIRTKAVKDVRKKMKSVTASKLEIEKEDIDEENKKEE